MTDEILLVRIADRTGSLERVLGRIRARLRRLPEISLGTAGDGNLVLAVALEGAGTRGAGLASVLAELRDVHYVRRIDAADPVSSRELVLARVRGARTPPGAGRVVERHADGEVIEITGTRAEIDRALERMREAGVLRETVRTGRIVPPRGPDPGRPDTTRSNGPDDDGIRNEGSTR